MDILHKIDMILNDGIWSGAVKTSWSPPEGLFSKSAKDIADVLVKASKDLKQAINRLQFYENRAGKNLTKERISTLNKAKELIRKAYEGK